MSASFLTRFAPSPTGHLHIGHACAAREAFETARAHGGQCLLRIEDIDQTRCRPDYVDAIYEDLRWLGFDWPQPVRVQSEHFDDYIEALLQLIGKGLVYRSFLTRRQLAADLEKRGIKESPAGVLPYPGPETSMSENEEKARLERGHPFAWRLSLARCRDYLGDQWHELGFEEQGGLEGYAQGWVKAQPDWLGDVILARKDTPTSYHLAVTHDDALQGISHIVRGADLYYATHIHVLLQKLFGWPLPRYHHHGLMLDKAGRKFSKSDKSKTLRSLREEGYEPADLKRLLSDGVE